MVNEFNQAYEQIIKKCAYIGCIPSVKGEIEVWEKREKDRLFLIDKNNEKFLSRKKEDDSEWYENSKYMIISLIQNNSLLTTFFCSY